MSTTLSWNEIRTRAKAFAEKWAAAERERADTQTFYNEFFERFGMRREQVASYEDAVRGTTGTMKFIDLLWPGTLIIEQKSAGKDLDAAEAQALRYRNNLSESDRPRYILVCDFQTWRLRDLREDTVIQFPLRDLHEHVQAFGFIIGRTTHRFEDQDPVNIEAAELVGTLHDQLEDTGYTGTALEKFLVRIVFCLFADDTGIFEPKDRFLSWLQRRTLEDGSDLGALLTQLFQVLNTHPDDRLSNLDEDLAGFPYVNGDLFAESIPIPAFNSAMRKALIEASIFDWSPISPAIFGSLFQSVMNSDERRAVGAHYTTEKNIMKVIRPLFLDELWAEFDRAKALKRGRDKALDALTERLSGLQFLDPACGCGNFLVITYRELRKLETEILKVRLSRTRQLFDVADELSVVNVDQFHGIEIGEFPARIAETAMWMMDHIMNNELTLALADKDANYSRIPLVASANIRHADALEVEWEDVLPPTECDYVLGNPPFIGAKYQTKAQRQQVRDIADLGKSGGTLDFVAAWFIKAADYAGRGGKTPPHIAFVSTNSIVQGEQVAQLWPVLFERHKMEIAFAHRTFEWGSDARGKAHVHVVIVGLSRRENTRKVKPLYSYDDIKADPEETEHSWLSPYLLGADNVKNRHLVIERAGKPVSDVPKVVIGSKPIDGGNLIFTQEEADAFLKQEPDAKAYLRPYIGSREFLNGGDRRILALQDTSPATLRAMPKVRSRLVSVREFRKASKSAPTQALAATPTEFHVTTLPKDDFLVLPEVSSERRAYLPIGWLSPPVVPSNLVKVILDADLTHFAVLSSAIHMAWMRAVAGRMKSDYRYAIGTVYNTYPWPDLSDVAKATLTGTGQAILDARAAWPESTLADLYDPDTMPPNLRRAHQANDRAVDRLYRRKPFESERERVEHLFALYETLTAPVLAASKPKPKRRRKRVVKTS